MLELHRLICPPSDASSAAGTVLLELLKPGRTPRSCNEGPEGQRCEVPESFCSRPARKALRDPLCVSEVLRTPPTPSVAWRTTEPASVAEGTPEDDKEEFEAPAGAVVQEAAPDFTRAQVAQVLDDFIDRCQVQAGGQSTEAVEAPDFAQLRDSMGEILMSRYGTSDVISGHVVTALIQFVSREARQELQEFARYYADYRVRQG